MSLDERELIEYLDCISFSKEKKMKLRDTKYATELVPPAKVGGTRLEKLFVKHEGQEEIRVSWWKTPTRMAIRPVDMPERMWITLLAKGIKAGVLSPDFADKLKAAL